MTRKQLEKVVALLNKATLDDFMVIGRIVFEKMHGRAVRLAGLQFKNRENKDGK